MRYVSVVRLVRLSLYAENSFGCRSCGAQTKVIHLCQREECKNGSEHCGTVAEEEEEASNDWVLQTWKEMESSVYYVP